MQGGAWKEAEVQEDENEEEGPCHWHWSDQLYRRTVFLHEDKTTVTFNRSGSYGCVAIRGSKQLRQNMEHYFEVEMCAPFHGQARMVGLGMKQTRLQSSAFDFHPLMGRDQTSWGLNYTGMTCHAGDSHKYAEIDLERVSNIKIGVHYDGYYGLLSFDVNGHACGVAFNNIVTSLELYPMVCVSSGNTTVTLLHSFSSVLSLKSLCRGVIRMQLQCDEDADKLPIPSNLKSFLRCCSTVHKCKC